jgi:hypothetical protein
VSAFPPKADIDWLFPSSENFPVRSEVFPATRLKIPCSAAQGVMLSREPATLLTPPPLTGWEEIIFAERKLFFSGLQNV